MDMQVLTVVFSVLGAALSAGLGAVGSGVGIGQIGKEGVFALARQKGQSGNIIKMMLVSQAACGTPGIFSLLIALMLLYPSGSVLSFPKAVALISAGIAAGAGTLGPGIGCGIVGTYACRAVSYNPKTDAVLLRTMLVAQAVSQTTAVYALIIAMVLIYAV